MEKFFEDSVVLDKLHEFEEKINNELSQEQIDKEKIMKLRNEQLMKGILMTQDPNYYLNL